MGRPYYHREPRTKGVPEIFKTTHPLLVHLFALALNGELLLLAPELRRSLPLELVPVDRQGPAIGTDRYDRRMLNSCFARRCLGDNVSGWA
jgi:hypothetical protein